MPLNFIGVLSANFRSLASNIFIFVVPLFRNHFYIGIHYLQCLLALNIFYVMSYFSIFKIFLLFRHYSSTTEYSNQSPDYPEYSPSEDEGLYSGRSSSTVTYEGDNEDVEVHKQHDRKHNIPKTNIPSLVNLCDGHVDATATLRNELFVFRDQVNVIFHLMLTTF